jgi:hypothetical protein
MSKPNLLYQFSETSNNDWQVIDDTVMGGRSSGNFKTNEAGNGVFYGTVSLENNGGFSSVMHNGISEKLTPNKKFVIRLKGDGKEYQFRAKSDKNSRHTHLSSFSTNGKWQEVEISFDEMHASFRGRKLDLPNFKGEKVEEIRFLIANKKNESFELEIDWIKAI